MAPPTRVRHAHEIAVHRALHAAGILHPDRHLRKQRLEHARRREVIRGPDLAHVGHHGLGRFRAADAVAGDERLRVGEDVLADPRRRQVGEHHIVIAEAFHLRRGPGAVDQRVVRQHHALRVRGGPRSEEHRRRVFTRALGDLGIEKRGVALKERGADLEQLVVGHQLPLLVVPHAARLVVVDVPEARALRQDLEQLVDLLLVLGNRMGDFGILDGERHLGGHRVLVQRHRHRAEALCGAHRRVDPRAVVADQRDVIAALEPLLGEPAGERAHLVGKPLPRPGLPDAEILLADRGTLPAHLGVVQQQLGKRIQAGKILPHSPSPPE